MLKIFKVLFVIFSLIFLLYLLLPGPPFPNPPPDALQSNEPADTETLLRRAYFTDFTREQIIEFYKKEFEKPTFLGIPFFTERLNYPPEEAKTLIRDQTRSTFLEELVHPFRESVFINGFEAKSPKDTILIAGKVWRFKITVRYVPSRTIVRIVVALFTIAGAWFVINEYRKIK